MSFQAMTWAMAQTPGNYTEKYILLIVANYANDNGQCWPSNATLARQTMCSETTVKTALRSLAAQELISITPRIQDGQQLSNMITLHMHVSAQSGGASNDTGGREAPGAGSRAARGVGARRASGGGRHAPTNLSLEPINSDSPLTPRKRVDVSAKGRVGKSEALDAFQAYNVTAERCGLQKASKMTPDRQRKISARLKDYGADGWIRALANIEHSAFLTGANDRGWRADLDWLLSPAKFAKVHDGGYGNGRAVASPSEAARAADLERYRREAAAILGG